MSESRPRIVDLAHFNRDRKLTSSLQIDPADDGGIFLSLTGNARDVGSQGNKRITWKGSPQELAYLIKALDKYFNNK